MREKPQSREPGVTSAGTNASKAPASPPTMQGPWVAGAGAGSDCIPGLNSANTTITFLLIDHSGKENPTFSLVSDERLMALQSQCANTS